jgi:hypothetical protein
MVVLRSIGKQNPVVAIKLQLKGDDGSNSWGVQLKGRKDFMKKIMPGQIVTMWVDVELPEGEIRLNRKRWPKNSSPVIVLVLFRGLFFTLARAAILVGKEKRLFYAEGISRLSPLDDPHNPGRDKAWKPILKKKKLKEIPEAKVDLMVSCERAIEQAVEALHTRVMKNRRSFHHFRG